MPLKSFLSKGERQKYYFWGWNKEKKDICSVEIPENHPALIKLSKGQYYLIEGLENIPFCQKCKREKIVKLEDKISLKKC